MIIHFLKMLFSKSYAQSYRNKIEIKLSGYGEVNWNLLDDDGGKTPKKFTVHFFENDIGQRNYKVIGSEHDKKFYWHRLTHFHDAELWKSSGLRPEWFEDILIKKLSK